MQEFEKIQVLFKRAMNSVPEVTEALRMCDVPMSVKDAEHLMQEDLKLKESLVNKVAEAELNIDGLLSSLESDEEGGRKAEGKGAKSGDEDYISMQEALRKMLKDLKVSQGQFDGFWTLHKARVDHMMHMCHFKQTAEKVRDNTCCEHSC